MSIAMLVATVGAGLFAGAAVYVTVAEHPARVECGPALAVKEFGPSYRRAAVMQGVLAVVGLLSGVGRGPRGQGQGGSSGGCFSARWFRSPWSSSCRPTVVCSIRGSTAVRVKHLIYWPVGVGSTPCVQL